MGGCGCVRWCKNSHGIDSGGTAFISYSKNPKIYWRRVLLAKNLKIHASFGLFVLVMYTPPSMNVLCYLFLLRHQQNHTIPYACLSLSLGCLSGANCCSFVFFVSYFVNYMHVQIVWVAHWMAECCICFVSQSANTTQWLVNSINLNALTNMSLHLHSVRLHANIYKIKINTFVGKQGIATAQMIKIPTKTNGKLIVTEYCVPHRIEL